jgi:predicted XRE-type DNA-binding protein
VISVVAPITNTGTSSSAILGLDQTALSIFRSQVSDFTSGTVAQATNASTAVYATTSGTATYATTSGTAVTISNSITKSQVSDFVNGTVAQATNASTATYATTAGTSVGVSGSAITRSQISDFASGTVAVGTANALLAGANTFTAGQTISNGTASSTALFITAGTATNKAVVVRGAATQSVNMQEWQTSAGATVTSVSSNGLLTGNGITTAGTVTFSGSFASLITGGTAGTSGQVLTSAGTGASPTWSSVSASTALTAGTAFYANTSGTATAVSGSAITESQVVNLVSDLAAKAPISYVYTSSAVITNSFPSTTTAISIFGGTATPTFGFTVSADSTYEYEFYGYLQQTGALSTQTPTWSIGSTAVTLSPVVAHVTDFGFTTNTTGLTTAATLSKARTTTGVAMTAITTAGRYYDVVAKGIIRVTGTGTVKVYPALSATVSVDNVWTWRDGTTFKLTYIGNGTATSIGTWS